MLVKNLMTQGAHTCQPDSNLAEAAKTMFEGDCGLLAVLDKGKLCGVITDRDICMAMMFRGGRAVDIRVQDVMSGEHFTCRGGEDVTAALQKMAEHQVRRLPVVGADGELEGMLSLNDLVMEAKASRAKTGAPTYKDVVSTLQKIGQHRDLPVAG